MQTFLLFLVFVFLGSLFSGICVIGFHLWRLERGDYYAIVLMRKNVWRKLKETDRELENGKARLFNDIRSIKVH